MKWILMMAYCCLLAGCSVKTVEIHLWGKYYQEKEPVQKDQANEPTIEVTIDENHGA
ncbi:MAG: hypothetical protein ACPGXK_00210 [Phycisphaerae bacterium]